MFNQTSYSEAYDKEKLKILQTLNVQIQTMAVKLDQIITQAEENIFKLKSSPNNNSNNGNNNFKDSLIAITNSIDNKAILLPITTSNSNLNKIITINNLNNNQNTITNCPTLTAINGNLFSQNLIQNIDVIKLENHQQLIKIVDQPVLSTNQAQSTVYNQNQDQTKSTKNSNRSKRSIANLTVIKQESQVNTQNIKQEKQQQLLVQNDENSPSVLSKTTSINTSISSNSVTSTIKSKQESHVINKRNKQQRIFNTFVRESINQLLGADFMRTHDVQDIDSQVMEMIRKEAVENYLPDNIRPRRAWHLAKASLRTLKRTLNNRKPK